MKDILLVMSDQHGQAFTQMEDPRIDTPNLVRIGREGMTSRRCYCSAPLCVPSRMSFLTGLLPSQLSIFNNDSALGPDIPTIAHGFGEKGYHTVLIGRMHFKGDDQLHGFDERLAGDITSQYWGTGGQARTDFGAYVGTTNRKHCLDAVGGGYSPVMNCDRLVFQSALDYLKQPHEKPQFIIVGFYGPHFPFVCDPDTYEKYKMRFPIGETDQAPADDIYDAYRMECPAEKVRNCKAAYCGLAEAVDFYTGKLYDCFRQRRKDYAFVYTSDHGEQLGRRGIFGKQTLYEDSIRVPLVIQGTGIPKGEFNGQVSLLDVSKTLLELGGIDAPWHGGAGIFSCPEASRPPAVIQQLAEYKGCVVPAQAVISWPLKAVKYGGDPVQIYDLQKDSVERENIASSCPEFLAFASGYFLDEEEGRRCVEQELKKQKQQKQLKAWGRVKKPREWAVVQNPPEARQKPMK